MSMFFDIEQNSEEWYSLKLGKFSASMISDLFADKKTKTYQNTITRIAFERITGRSQEKYSNGWMKHGHEFEPEAAEAYEMMTFCELGNGGLWLMNDWYCASPDRKIKGQNGGIEIKCPSFQVYRDYLQKQEIPKDYLLQMYGQMLATGWDFVDYMPYVSPNVKQLLTRVERDEAKIKELDEKIQECIEETQILINQIKQ